MIKQTKFTFFKNTPLIDFQNTIHFSSNTERDSFFLRGNHYSGLQIEHNNFNFIRDRSSLKINVPYEDMQGVNYCTFKSEFEDVRYYAYVMNYEYLNDEAIRVDLLIDGIMTFMNGNTLLNLTNLTVQRQHLERSNYNERLWALKNNGDIMNTETKSYFKQQSLVFKDFYVLIQSGVDLLRDFGTVDNPLIETSGGNKFDKITSPLNLYVVDFDQFTNLMSRLAKYPWIAQNIQKLILVPKEFLKDNITRVRSKFTLKEFKHLNVVTGSRSNKNELIKRLDEINYSMDELYTLFGLDPKEDKHLLRNEYGTCEIYDWNGGGLFVDLGQLNERVGLTFRVDVITGYHNEIVFFINNYRNETFDNSFYQSGSYLNDAIIFKDFDDVPMLIDNYNLSLAKSANQRELTESKLVSNRMDNVMDPNADLKDRFMDASSLISNFSIGNMFGKFSDEHEYYRQQKAEQADLALETPTMTNQSFGNSFNIANDQFGLHLKFSKPSKSELLEIKKYYKLFGYEVNEKNVTLNNVRSMTMANYVQFEGSWTIKNTDVALVEMMKAQFENGVRLWHNNNTANPMQQDILNNKMRG